MKPEKTDYDLGAKIQDILINEGMENPMTGRLQMRPEVIEGSFCEIMTKGLNLDLTDDSLKETPARFAKMYIDEIFYGLNYENFPAVSTFENKMHYDEMILEKNIQVRSHCEHHFVPIIGKAHVAYIPNRRVVGLSKMNRVVDFFSRRPQVQERLTAQIHTALQVILDTLDVAVVIEADHFCVKTRGVEDDCSDTTTSKLGGHFFKPEVRSEFMSLIK